MSSAGAETVGVIGGGIVGMAIARELTRRRPGATVVVLEKEDRLGAHQTGHNSGVVHAGIYYKPGSLKAELCTRGRLLLKEFCAEKGLAYEECGKLVVAVDSSELGRFETLEATARENGVPGLTRLEGADITDVEPYAAGLLALHSPATAITDYVAVAAAYGMDMPTLMQIISHGTGQSFNSKNWDFIASHWSHLRPLGQKDVNLFIDAAKSKGMTSKVIETMNRDSWRISSDERAK